MILVLKIVAASFILAVFLSLWRLESGSRLIVITPFLFLGYYELLRVLPPFFVANQYGVTESLFPLLVASTAFGAVVFGFVIAYAHTPIRRQISRTLSTDLVLRLPQRRGEMFGVFAVVGVLLATGVLLYGGAPPTLKAVAGLVTGGGGEFAALVSDQRFELTKAAYFGGEYRGQGIIRTIQRVGWGLVLSYLALRYAERRTVNRMLWVGIGVLGAWIFVAGDGTRGPFLHVILVAIGAYSLRNRLRVRTAFVLFCVGIGLAILMSLYSNKMYFAMQQAEGNFLQQGVSQILTRVFLGNGMNDVRVIDMVHAGEMQLRWGALHARSFISSLPGVQYGVPLSYELFLILNPSSRGTSFQSGTYISDVYVDFGFLGIVPIFLLVGVTIGAMQRWLLRGTPTAWGLSVKVVVAYLAAGIVRTGFHGFGAQMVVLGAIVVIHNIVASFSRGIVRSRSVRRPGPEHEPSLQAAENA